MNFKRFYFLLVLLPTWAFGQPKTFYHKDTLKVAANTVGVRFSHMKTPLMLAREKSDTIDLGSDGRPGKTVTVYLERDSIQIRNENYPYEEKHFFPLQLAGRNYTLRLRFNRRWAYFSSGYINKNRGRALVEIPEAFELANILLMLSPAGQKAGNMVTTGQYQDEVVAHFKPFLDHPVFKALAVPEEQYFMNYYEFRENSICYEFSGDNLIPSQYFFVMGADDSTYTNLFANNTRLVADFARKSKFRDFYKAHLPYYRQLITRQTEWSDVPGMQRWLGRELPQKRSFDTSKLLFSPIIFSSHSTQRFGEYDDDGTHFEEMLLFVSGPDVYNTRSELNDNQRRGLLSGIIFTEVDHNYVNPQTDDFEFSIDSIFGNRDFWATPSRGGFYVAPAAVFNEYMTHALFSLYAIDTFDKPTADFLIAHREAMMVESRGFVKFREFNTTLIQMKKENPDTPVSELYPKIIDWCRAFAQR